MSKFIFIEPERHKLAVAIGEATGVDVSQIRRIVIDLQVEAPGNLYLEMYGDDSILDVDIAELGIEVKEVPAAVLHLPDGVAAEEAESLRQQWLANHAPRPRSEGGFLTRNADLWPLVGALALLVLAVLVLAKVIP